MHQNGISNEASALIRLIAAARAVANLGSIDHNDFIVSAELGRELRAALADYDQAVGDDDET